MADPDILALKSWLFTPATKPDRFDRAAKVHAGALIIDLEDAVAPADKAGARDTAIHYLQARAPGGVPCALRINTPHAKVGFDDLAALLASSADPEFVVIPKCDSAGTLALVGNLLREAGKTSGVIALIESVAGVAALEEMAGHASKPAAFLFGAADMAADLGAAAAWQPLLYTRSRLVRVAAGAGIAVVDSPFFDIADEAGLRRETRDAADLGFHAKCAIHPGQIGPINDVLTPSAQDVAWARQVLEVNRQGVGSVDGQMIDEAVARRARLIMARA